MCFSGAIAPYYPQATASAGTRNVQGVYKALSQMTMRVAEEAGYVRDRAAMCRTLLDFEDEAFATKAAREEANHGGPRNKRWHTGGATALCRQPQAIYRELHRGASDAAEVQRTLRTARGGSEGSQSRDAQAETPGQEQHKGPPAAGGGELTGAVKPHGILRDGRAESEPPGWSPDEPAGLLEVEREETPALAVEQVVAQALKTVAEQRQELFRVTLQETRKTLSTITEPLASADAQAATNEDKGNAAAAETGGQDARRELQAMENPWRALDNPYKYCREKAASAWE